MSAMLDLMNAGFCSQRIPVTNEVAPNVVRNFGRIHISYNQSARDYGCATTAVVLGGRVFFVLNGNHALALTEAMTQGGPDAVMGYYIDNLDQANSKSEHFEVLGESQDIFNLRDTVLEVLGVDGCKNLVRKYCIAKGIPEDGHQISLLGM